MYVCVCERERGWRKGGREREEGERVRETQREREREREGQTHIEWLTD